MFKYSCYYTNNNFDYATLTSYLTLAKYTHPSLATQLCEGGFKIKGCEIRKVIGIYINSSAY